MLHEAKVAYYAFDVAARFLILLFMPLLWLRWYDGLWAGFAGLPCCYLCCYCHGCACVISCAIGKVRDLGGWSLWSSITCKNSPFWCSPQRISSPVLVHSCICIAITVPVHVNHVCILFMCEFTRHFDEPFHNAPIVIKPVNCSTPHTMTTLTCSCFTISL